MTNDLLLTEQLCELLGVDERTLLRWRQDGCGPPYIRLGGLKRGPIRYPRKGVDAWLAGRTFPHRAAEAAGHNVSNIAA
ncbi:MAG: helix-turn-helix domain-containing protein [Acetobacteraceae bacterium]|nr:helix-turn-helix domain-containing protein [Acetobacteraceae bacterium]MBV8592272.1 helix-turn-helix domain-containing protein [Acetobacteraceae bacterium]